MCIGLHVKCRLLLSGFYETWIFPRQIFEKHSNTEFHEKPSSGSRDVPRGREDRHDEATSRRTKFCERAVRTAHCQLRTLPVAVNQCTRILHDFRTPMHYSWKQRTEVTQFLLLYRAFWYTECNRRNGPDFGSVFLRSNYTDNPKHLYPKLNGYGDIGQRKEWTSLVSAYCTCR